MVSSTSILFLLSALTSTTLAQCFWPAGNPAPGMVACTNGNGGGASTCCSSADMCLSNGLCKINSADSAIQYARGACTDANWGPGCLQQCQKQSHPGSFITNTAAIFLCSGHPSDASGASYCCETAIDQGTGCCSGTTFSLPQGIAPGGSSSPTPKAGVFLQASSSSSSSAAAAVSTISSSSSSSSSSTSCTSTYTPLTSLAGNTTSYSSLPAVSAGPSPSSNGTIVTSNTPTAPGPTATGAAGRVQLGGGLGLVAVMAAGWMVL